MRFVSGSTLVTLVASCPILAAVWAFALHVAVWKESSTVIPEFVILLHGLLLEQSRLSESEEVLLDEGLVVGITGPIEQGATIFDPAHIHVGLPTATEIEQRLGVDCVVAVDNRLR